MYTIYHQDCGNPAFQYSHRPRAGEQIRIDKARQLSGARPVPGSVMVCGTCGHRLAADRLSPGLVVYDMTSDKDMGVLYGEYNHKR